MQACTHTSVQGVMLLQTPMFASFPALDRIFKYEILDYLTSWVMVMAVRKAWFES
jgi:hypothetical protein